VNRGDPGALDVSNKFLSAVTGACTHSRGAGDCDCDALSKWVKSFEAGMVRTMWDGAIMDGTNSMLLLVRWMLGSKFLPEMCGELLRI